MKLARAWLEDEDLPTPVVELPGRGFARLRDVVPEPSPGVELYEWLTIIDPAQRRSLLDSDAPLVAVQAFAAPYDTPQKILGIGLNYRRHAADLRATSPDSTPVSFIKANHTIIGSGEPIIVPQAVGRVTAEAELGLIIGRECRKVSADEAMGYVAGVTAVLDQTAEDVLLQNPRFLSRAKNYPTFFSFGPCLASIDEVMSDGQNLDDLEVATIINGREHRRDHVNGMVFSPATLVSSLSHVMPLFPGDIISTGTPGAVQIRAEDTVQCDIRGLMTLTNSVVGDTE